MLNCSNCGVLTFKHNTNKVIRVSKGTFLGEMSPYEHYASMIQDERSTFE